MLPDYTLHNLVEEEEEDNFGVLIVILAFTNCCASIS